MIKMISIWNIKSSILKYYRDYVPKNISDISYFLDLSTFTSFIRRVYFKKGTPFTGIVIVIVYVYKLDSLDGFSFDSSFSFMSLYPTTVW